MRPESVNIKQSWSGGQGNVTSSSIEAEAELEGVELEAVAAVEEANIVALVLALEIVTAGLSALLASEFASASFKQKRFTM